MTTLFESSVKIRGFLGRDAEIHASEPITDGAYVVLHVATMRGTWDIALNEWNPRIDWHRIVCEGPWFCGFLRGMRRGEYLEIEAEMREIEEVRIVVVGGQNYPVKRMTTAIFAVHVQRLDRPLWVVDSGDSD
ncbi:hypothetical protein [Silvibacterium dinghuense]|uniref:Single-stranded DNA-binding protein n=1 Tax=Silvibacterium dinghuense TaxID=1560006 RepID=A0A4Q1SJA1_9BACT|nr:hypothetical protein [Silvibacterium dinghuense]RXS97505.1 hypothetical protein ESZ00_06330 [Silvibacterium dinghuense]GGG99553.1 hypothetical protein GCM10011586_13890 [Silvibacterium dinghuense]